MRKDPNQEFAESVVDKLKTDCITFSGVTLVNLSTLMSESLENYHASDKVAQIADLYSKLSKRRWCGVVAYSNCSSPSFQVR